MFQMTTHQTKVFLMLTIHIQDQQSNNWIWRQKVVSPLKLDEVNGMLLPYV